MSATITENVLEGLLAIHRYRFLSVDQFARASCLKASHVRDVLRTFERKSLLGSIGNVGLRGGAKAPKLYHLTRSGYAAMLEREALVPQLVDESEILAAMHTPPADSPARRRSQLIREYAQSGVAATIDWGCVRVPKAGVGSEVIWLDDRR